MANEVVFKKQKKNEIKQSIKEIKERAKQDILVLKKELKIELAADKTDALRKIQARDEKKRLYQEKKAAYYAGPKRYSVMEEIWNSITHGIGVGLSIAALVILLVRAVALAPQAEMTRFIVGYSIFGSSLIILYLMSTLYHALTPYGAKKVFAIFDHSSIYLLIAGTYTPFCLTVLHGALGWTLFGIIWGLAILGVVFYAVFGNRMRALSAITYVLMGWLIIFAFGPMKAAAPAESIIYLIVGGAAYTLGVIVYALKKIPHTHSIWHLFVLAGSIFHFFSLYVLL